MLCGVDGMTLDTLDDYWDWLEFGGGLPCVASLIEYATHKRLALRGVMMEHQACEQRLAEEKEWQRRKRP